MGSILDEYNIKRDRLKEYLESRDLKGVLLTRRSNYSWLTCGGRNKILDCTEEGAATLLFYEGKLYLFTTNIEMQRMKDEETGGLDIMEFIEYKWFQPEDLKKKIERIADLDKTAQDSPVIDNVKMLDSGFNKIKMSLTDGDKERYIELGRISSKCVTNTCRDIEKGMSEFRVQAILSDYLISEGVFPGIILVASDRRLFEYRHPVPTGKEIEKYAMVVCGGVKWGLFVSITRLVYFGNPPDEVIKARDIITKIDAEMILSSRPGTKYSEILENEIENFKSYGLPDEWHNHHQGGPGGYEGRFFLTNRENEEIIEADHSIAWNPSMRGFKSEDTFIVEKDKNIIISRDDRWPAINVHTEYGDILRSDILLK